MSDRMVLGLASLLLAAHAVLALAASSRVGVTTDEPVGIVGGFAILTRGEMHLNFEHPPLVKTVSALPLLGWHPDIDASDPDYRAGRQWIYSKRFVFDSGVDPDQLMLRARAATILFDLLLGGALFWFAQRSLGGRAALLALGFWAFDPNFLAHGPLVQFDVGLSLFVFSAAMSWHRALVTGRRGWFALAGLLLGLGLSTKFSAVYIVPIWMALAALERRHLSRDRVLGGVLSVLMAAIGLTLGYGWVLLPDFLRGFYWQVEHAMRGHMSWFWGELRPKGSPFYFPVAFLLKTPLETLAALALLASTRVSTGFPRRVVAGLLAGGTFFLLLIPASINIGHRYMLPVYPFLFLALGSLADPGRRWRSSSRRSLPTGTIGFILVGFLALRAFLAFPDYLGSFNLLAGSRPERILADSNLDWGQGLPQLAAWLAERGNPEVRLAYSGMDSPHHRGIRSLPAPCHPEPGLYAASVNHVLGILPARNRPCHRWLHERQPLARIGTSILVYEVPDLD